MVKRSTWIVLLLLVLVVGAYFLIKNKQESNTTDEVTPTATAEAFLITEADGTLESLSVSDGTFTFLMQRGTYNAWEIVLPEPGTADLALASAVETQVSDLRIVSRIETPPALADMGLDKPAYTFEFKFEGGATRTVEIGNLTPTGSGYYARVNRDTVCVVSTAGIDALANLLTAPPYPPTSTPTPEPTATATPETTGTPTLETVTPTP